MHIESMRYFVELANAGSFSAAARNLFISPQGLNKAIGTIEREFGSKLVERNRHGIVLTPEGKVFYRHAVVIVSEIGAIVDDIAALSSTQDSREKPLKITASSYATSVFSGLNLAGSTLGTFTLQEETIPELLKLVEGGGVDELFLTELYPLLQQQVGEMGNISFEPILSTRTGVIWTQGFELADHETIHRFELRDVPIAYNSHQDMRRYAEALFAEAPLENVQLKTSSIRLLVEFAHKQFASLFDSYGYHVAVRDPDIPMEGVRFTPLATPEAQLRVGFLYRKDARPNARCRRTIEVVKRLFNTANAEYASHNPV